MIESKPIGKLVRFILKAVFILGGLALIIVPMFGQTGMTLQEYGNVISGAVCAVLGLIVASIFSMLARALVKIKAPSIVLTIIVVVSIVAGYLLGYLLGRYLLKLSIVLAIIMLIVGAILAVFATIQTGMLLSLSAVSPFLLSDEERETLRRNVKNNNIPAEFTTGRGAKVLDRILYEQGLGSRDHIRMSDD